MKGERLEVLRGSDNVYRDLGRDNADVKQFKALLAAEIIKARDARPVPPWSLAIARISALCTAARFMA
jgi:hypothetical protein